MQKIKLVSPKKAMRGSKAFGRHFLWKRETFWIGSIKPLGKFGSGLQYSFHLNTKVTLYCDAKMNVISDVLRDREGRFSKTTTNF